jgi:capsular exopolysaccharide synthesis family protein
VIDALRASLLDLKRKERALLVEFTEEHPQIRALRQEMGILTQEIALSKQSELRRLQQEIDLGKERQRLRQERMDANEGEHQRLQEVLRGNQDEIIKMSELKDFEENLSHQLSIVKMLQRQTVGALDVKLVATMERAWAAPKVSNKSWPFVTLISLCTCVFVVFLLEYVDTRIKTEHDVRKHVNLPIFCRVPRQSSDEPLILLEMEPQSRFTEIFMTAATLIHATAKEVGAKSFVVTSTKEEEGKTTISANLGIALARKGLRVIVVDSDLRRPQIHSLLGLGNDRGLVSVLQERLRARRDPDAHPLPAGGTDLSEALEETAEPNLMVLPCGPIPDDPAALLESEEMIRLMEELHAGADYVIYDTPPIYHVGDALTLAPRCDANLMVIGSKLVTQQEVTWAKHLLESVNSVSIGCILNMDTYDSEGYGYYYNYKTKVYRAK